MTTQPVLQLQNVTKRFGGLVAVRDLSFTMAEGEILGLIGPNGAGKSTTFNVISGFYKPSDGELSFRGENITGLKPSVVCKRGLVRTFQHDSLLREMTVYDNIVVGAYRAVPVKGQRAEHVRQTARLLGIEAHLDDVAGKLSHGVQRLVSIAIALAARPRLLCLDEPLTGLNQTEVGTALDAFRRIRTDHNCGILLVEHNMKAVMSICDRVVVLDHGEFLTSGTPEEVKRNPAVISAYLGTRQ